MAWLADKLTMLRRTEAAKPNAIKLLASMASITLKPQDVGCFAELRMLNTQHFSKFPPCVARGLDRCLGAIAMG